MQITAIPLAAINPAALPRDRSAFDTDALNELQFSIAESGLRQPIEVWHLSTPTEDGQLYGLISGLRRLTAHQNLARLNPEAWANIPAFIRTPRDIPDAIATMIAENEIRADPSPWDKGRILVQVVEEGHFATLDEAVTRLYPTASRQKRARFRAVASVVDLLAGQISTPEVMAERHLLRLAAALRGGFTDLIQHILKETHGKSFATQWTVLLPTLAEAERGEEDIPATATSPSRPRRLLELRQGLTIRREATPQGYALCFSGPEARRNGVMDDVMDYVERLFQPKY